MIYGISLILQQCLMPRATKEEFPGSSGSPVYIDLTYENFKNGQIAIGNKKIRLLGIVAQTMVRNNQLQAVPTGTAFATQEVLGLGIVFKSTTIKELIDSMPT